jgi:RNA polymerase sigma-70 factor (ECF subfamily)
MAESDEALAARCQQDDDAFRELFRRYNRRLYRYVWGMLKSAADAEDVIQETFVRLFKHAHKFDTQRRFSTWFYTIAANQCRNRLRKRGRHQALSLDTESAPDPPDTDSPGPLEVYELQDVRAQVDAAIEELPPLYREALHLRYLEGLSYKEFAQVVDASVSAVETRIFRGKEMLRDELSHLAESTEAKER